MKNQLIWVALSATLTVGAALTLSDGNAPVLVAPVQAQEAAGAEAAGAEAAQTQAKPLLHPLFSDNAVLQRDRAVPLWGWTVPGTTVAVAFDSQKQTARAAADGRWTVSLPPHAAGGAPHSLSVAGAGGASVTRRNLVFGDVWLCGGQSNMAYDLYGALNPEAEIAAANYPDIRLAPSDTSWSGTREAQLQTSQRLPNTPLVVTIDLGEEKNVHYPNKQEVGARLARSALANTYGVKIEGSGPTLRVAKAVKGAMQLSFDHAQGLNLKGEVNRVFAVAGADRKFAWATPQIAGDVVTLRSADVPAPLYARFGWSDNPRAALYNAAALPASPFRTDKQP